MKHTQAILWICRHEETSNLSLWMCRKLSVVLWVVLWVHKSNTRCHDNYLLKAMWNEKDKEQNRASPKFKLCSLLLPHYALSAFLDSCKSLRGTVWMMLDAGETASDVTYSLQTESCLDLSREYPTWWWRWGNLKCSTIGFHSVTEMTRKQLTNRLTISTLSEVWRHLFENSTYQRLVAVNCSSNICMNA